MPARGTLAPAANRLFYAALSFQANGVYNWLQWVVAQFDFHKGLRRIVNRLADDSSLEETAAYRPNDKEREDRSDKK